MKKSSFGAIFLEKFTKTEQIKKRYSFQLANYWVFNKLAWVFLRKIAWVFSGSSSSFFFEMSKKSLHIMSYYIFLCLWSLRLRCQFRDLQQHPPPTSYSNTKAINRRPLVQSFGETIWALVPGKAPYAVNLAIRFHFVFVKIQLFLAFASAHCWWLNSGGEPTLYSPFQPSRWRRNIRSGRVPGWSDRRRGFNQYVSWRSCQLGQPYHAFINRCGGGGHWRSAK